MNGAMSVTCLGWLRIALAAITTIQSMPPATCIVAAARITARMIRIASTGGEPGVEPEARRPGRRRRRRPRCRGRRRSTSCP